MGTNIPHTCIPGLVWQKQARRFSQFELKVGELGFPIHFVCVSAALLPSGARGRHFIPLGEYGPFQFLFFNTRTQSDCACRGHGQACLDRRVLLVSQTVVESIQLFFCLKWRPSREWWDTSQIHGLFRPQKLVEASSNSTTINLLKLPKMWRLLIRVEKRLMVLSFVPESTRRNIQHLKDYPVFKVFFFDFRTLAVSRSTRYASAQRAAHCDSRTACGIETSKRAYPATNLKKRAYRDTNELLRARTNARWASDRKLKNELRRARMSSSANYGAQQHTLDCT